MVKVKHERTADCVVAGYRLHKSGPVVGSLLLGLYDDGGPAPARRASAPSFPMRRRAELMDGAGAAADGRRSRATRGRRGPSEDGAGRAAGCPARPAAGPARRTCRGCRCARSGSCEVAYDHMQGDRFRHTAQFRRWRPDRDARRAAPTPSWRSRCGYDLADVLASGRV